MAETQMVCDDDIIYSEKKSYHEKYAENGGQLATIFFVHFWICLICIFPSDKVTDGLDIFDGSHHGTSSRYPCYHTAVVVVCGTHKKEKHVLQYK